MKSIMQKIWYGSYTTAIVALLLSGTACNQAKEKELQPQISVHKTMQSVSLSDHDAALKLLSKGLVDLLDNPSFVQNDLYMLFGPRDEVIIDEPFLNYAVRINGQASTIHEQMNLSIERYSTDVRKGDDHVTNLLDKFKVNNVQYEPTLYFPNHLAFKQSNITVHAAPGIGYDAPEGEEGDIIKAWEKSTNEDLNEVIVRTCLVEKSS